MVIYTFLLFILMSIKYQEVVAVFRIASILDLERNSDNKSKFNCAVSRTFFVSHGNFISPKRALRFHHEFKALSLPVVTFSIIY